MTKQDENRICDKTIEACVPKVVLLCQLKGKNMYQMTHKEEHLRRHCFHKEPPLALDRERLRARKYLKHFQSLTI